MKLSSGKIMMVSCLVLALGSSHMYTQSNVNAAYDRLQERLAAVKTSMVAIKEVRSENTLKIIRIQEELSQLDTDTHRLLDQIKQLEASSEGSGQRIAESKARIADREALLKQRLRAMNKMTPTSTFAFLLESENIVDVYKRLDMLSYICQSDKALLEALKQERDSIQAEKDVYDQEKYELLKLGSRVNKINEESNNRLILLYREQLNLKNDLIALAEQEDMLLAASDQLEASLKDYQSDQNFNGKLLMWPAPGNKRVSSPFGLRMHPLLNVSKMHTGIDIGAPFGAPVIAAEGGRVILSEWYGSYGKTVMIDHGNGVITLYAHNEKLMVTAGQLVDKGVQIAEIGSTGMSTGPHLHFEVRNQGKPTNPMGWL